MHNDAFSNAHPIFHWMWKISHDWGAIADTIPQLRAHHAPNGPRKTRGRSRCQVTRNCVTPRERDEEAYEVEYPHLIFKENFCLAAAELANQLCTRMDQLGTLYDRVVQIGALRPAQRSLWSLGSWKPPAVTTGQGGRLLLLVRCLSRAETVRFLAKGFELAPRARVQKPITKMLQIPQNAVRPLLDDLQFYANSSLYRSREREGTFLSCFAIIGRLNRQFDVLVHNEIRDQLPDVNLAPSHLSQMQLAFLGGFDQWTVGELIHQLRRDDLEAREDELMEFASHLEKSLLDLRYRVSQQWFDSLVFHATPIVSQYSCVADAKPAMIFGLTRLLDIYESYSSPTSSYAFLSLSLFRLRMAIHPALAENNGIRDAIRSEVDSLHKARILWETSASRSPMAGNVSDDTGQQQHARCESAAKKMNYVEALLQLTLQDRRTNPSSSAS